MRHFGGITIRRKNIIRLNWCPDEMDIIQTTWDGIIQNKTIDDRTFFTIGSWLSPTLTFWALNGLLW